MSRAGDAHAAGDADALAAWRSWPERHVAAAAVSAAAVRRRPTTSRQGGPESTYFTGCTARVPSDRNGRAPTSCVAFKPETSHPAPARWSAVRSSRQRSHFARDFRGRAWAPDTAPAQAGLEPGDRTRLPVMFGSAVRCTPSTDTVRWSGIEAAGDIHSNGNMRWARAERWSAKGRTDGTASDPAERRPGTLPAQGTPSDVSAATRTLSARYAEDVLTIGDFRPGGRRAGDRGGELPLQAAASGTLDRAWLRSACDAQPAI